MLITRTLTGRIPYPIIRVLEQDASTYVQQEVYDFDMYYAPHSLFFQLPYD